MPERRRIVRRVYLVESERRAKQMHASQDVAELEEEVEDYLRPTHHGEPYISMFAMSECYAI